MNVNLFDKNPTWRVLDRTAVSEPALTSFAIDDALCTAIAEGSTASTIHLWCHDSTIILGSKDARLSTLEKGVFFLQERGYEVIVRNSGGLAVVMDRNVLNLSIILPLDQSLHNINTGFEFMASIIKETLLPLGLKVESGEIKGSYCPGSYDLSINGQKFCGLAQRRRRGAVAIQGFINVSGSGQERAELLKQFYEKATEKEREQQDYPLIIPETVTSLSQIYKEKLENKSIKDLLYGVLHRKEIALTYTNKLSTTEEKEYQIELQRMKERNKEFKLK